MEGGVLFTFRALTSEGDAFVEIKGAYPGRGLDAETTPSDGSPGPTSRVITAALLLLTHTCGEVRAAASFPLPR